MNSSHLVSPNIVNTKEYFFFWNIVYMLVMRSFLSCHLWAINCGFTILKTREKLPSLRWLFEEHQTKFITCYLSKNRGRCLSVGGLPHTFCFGKSLVLLFQIIWCCFALEAGESYVANLRTAFVLRTGYFLYLLCKYTVKSVHFSFIQINWCIHDSHKL